LRERAAPSFGGKRVLLTARIRHPGPAGKARNSPLRGAELPAEQFDAREVARAIPASEYLELPGARSSAIVHIAGIESWLRTTPVTDPELVIGPRRLTPPAHQ
jgi:hypothetical protein